MAAAPEWPSSQQWKGLVRWDKDNKNNNKQEEKERGKAHAGHHSTLCCSVDIFELH